MRSSGGQVVPWSERALVIQQEIDDPDAVMQLICKEIQSTLAFDALLPTQLAVIPVLLQNSRRDVCVCAPTGSGKTLAYVIPMIQRLMQRNVPRIRAAVILPTKELAIQVESVIKPLAESVGLFVEMCTGQTEFSSEAERLRGNVDILVCTPGRLVDHIVNQSLSLVHVQMLVIDEADRLLKNSYQEWVVKVMDAIFPDDEEIDEVYDDPVQSRVAGFSNRIRKRRMQSQRSYRSVLRSNYVEPLQKLLFSATLTTDPQKLASLGLINPIFISSSSEKMFKIPATLKEWFVVVETNVKPLVLFSLLKGLQFANPSFKSVVFTSSVESAHRLSLLLSILDPNLKVCEFSRNLTLETRKKMIINFKKNISDSECVNVLVASDAMARGVDFPNLDLVFNYDFPAFTETYIHRVGRTARAGKKGECFTLLRSDQVAVFKKSLKSKVEGSNPVEFHLEKSTSSLIEHSPIRDFYESTSDHYENALKLLEKQIKQS
jgi:ATP-dependent RNA helicase DDX51/DBP6